MSLLDTGAYNDARTRVVAKSVKVCTIGELREMKGKDAGDGKPIRDVTFVPLTLAEAAKDTDGGDLPVGFPVTIGLGYYDNPGEDDGCLKANEISKRRMRELVVAALGLPANCENPHQKMLELGGPTALKGKLVLTHFGVGKTGMQNVDRFSAKK